YFDMQENIETDQSKMIESLAKYLKEKTTKVKHIPVDFRKLIAAILEAYLRDLEYKKKLLEDKKDDLEFIKELKKQLEDEYAFIRESTNKFLEESENQKAEKKE